MTTKPSWQDAPKWARWLAQDCHLHWWWYEYKPVYDETMKAWFDGRGRFEYTGLTAYSLKDPAATLEARP